MQKLAGGEGEKDVGRTAAKMGLNMTLSSQSTTSLEDVMSFAKTETSGQPLSPKFWFQIYLRPDMEHNVALIKRAEGTTGNLQTQTRYIADRSLNYQLQDMKL